MRPDPPLPAHDGQAPGFPAAGPETASAFATGAPLAAAAVPAPARFPHDAIAALERDGRLAANATAGPERPPAAEELGLVRAVSRADAGVGRILDGHLNAVERLAVAGPPALRDSELALVRSGNLRTGVWGADPRPDEGPAAVLVDGGRHAVVRGAKTFCSGAGGLDRALVLVRLPEESQSSDGSGPPPVAVWLDVSGPTVEVDDTWFGGAGLRSSVSHRVFFHDTPVLAVLGPPGWLGALPWFARDALRTTATWAGIVDSAAEAALDELRRRPRPSELDALAAGRIRAEQATVDRWQERAAQVMDGGDGEELRVTSVHARAAISGAAGRLLDEAARACGSHPFATGGPLEQARLDLQVFLLQHRLDPLVARDGAAALAPEDAGRTARVADPDTNAAALERES